MAASSRGAGAVAVLASLLPAQAEPLTVPAFTAYAAGDGAAMQRGDDGAVRSWHGAMVFHGRFAHAGELVVSLQLLPGAKAGELKLEVGDQQRTATIAAGSREVAFAPLSLPAAGYAALWLRCTAGEAPGLRALQLGGAAAEAAHFSTTERRNAASVHLGYDVPAAAVDEVAWFYCEVTPRTDPLWTYYMATGWSRGYFGMQVNSATERRVIFSVWDSGSEAVDRSKVAAADRVQLLQRGDDVVAEGFGHEGTGGHSHKVVDWQVGTTWAFLVHAEADGDHTIYTGFCRGPGQPWQLIASFRAPKDGGLLRGLYSFNENFAGDNGDRLRRCEFHDQWVCTRKGDWLPLLRARFSHDGHGSKQRLDRSGGVIGNRFYLQNGGFVDDDADGALRQQGQTAQRAPGHGQPPQALPQLPAK